MLAKIEHSVNTRGMIGLGGQPMNFRTHRSWVAARCRNGKEQDAADWLKEQRYWAYWPCYAKHMNAGGPRTKGFARRRERFYSLIPGYLFIADQQGSYTDPAWMVETVPGVISYQRDATGKPLTLAESDIETIRRIEDGANLPPNPKTAHKFKIGQKVRFSDDLMSRWPVGTVDHLADDGRIGVGVSLLGRIVLVIAYPHQIEAM